MSRHSPIRFQLFPGLDQYKRERSSSTARSTNNQTENTRENQVSTSSTTNNSSSVPTRRRPSRSIIARSNQNDTNEEEDLNFESSTFETNPKTTIVSDQSQVSTVEIEVGSVVSSSNDGSSSISSETHSQRRDSVQITNPPVVLDQITTTQQTSADQSAESQELPVQLKDGQLQWKLPPNAANFDFFSHFQKLLKKNVKPITISRVEGFCPTGFVCIHVDPHVTQLPEYFEETLGPVMFDYCRDDIRACVSLICDYYEDKLIFLISSGSLARDLVPKIEQLHQVQGIYLHCGNVQFHREWTKNNEKIRVVTANEKSDILPQLGVDIAATYEFLADIKAEQKQIRVAKIIYKKALEIIRNVDGGVEWFEAIRGKILSLE